MRQIGCFRGRCVRRGTCEIDYLLLIIWACRTADSKKKS
jgi:hypothetical protein